MHLREMADLTRFKPLKRGAPLFKKSDAPHLF